MSITSDLFVTFSYRSSSLTVLLLRRGKPVLLPTILQLLNEEIGVDAKVDDNNFGRIRVSGVSIHKYIEANRWKE